MRLCLCLCVHVCVSVSVCQCLCVCMRVCSSVAACHGEHLEAPFSIITNNTIRLVVWPFITITKTQNYDISSSLFSHSILTKLVPHLKPPAVPIGRDYPGRRSVSRWAVRKGPQVRDR